MQRIFAASVSLLCSMLFVWGCGGGSSTTTQAISVTVSPTTATLASGQTTKFTATVTNSTAGVTWSVNGTAGGSTATGTIDSSGNFTAPSVTTAATATVTATSVADATKSASASVSVTPAVTVAVTPAAATIGASQVTQFMASVTGSSTGVTWSVAGTAGSGSTVGTIDSSGNFTAAAVTTNATATVTATSNADSTKSASATVTIIAPGIVAATANVQVANYTITPPAGATVAIQFGLDTTYGLTTWQQPAPTGGGAVSILVAGMKLSSAYHLRAVLTLADGSVFDDVDHTFTTGTTGTLTGGPLSITATTTPGATPQSGVELLDFISIPPPGLGVAVTDLSGNVLWGYNPVLSGGVAQANPIKLLPNGHFLINFNSSNPNDGTDSVIQEVDLAGTVIWQMTAADLNAALATATCAGCNITVVGTHHDFVALPNGHLIVIAAENQVETGLTGFPNPVTVTGDVIIDLDQNHKPVWLWSSFDHLDLNRHPLLFPDWTHTNSVVYSPDDKSLILSMRHQDWVLKIDYNDGQGAGDILWRLGYQGDFTLVGGTDPQDWFYAQHDANVISPNSSGVFDLLLFDDGNSRVLDTMGTQCGSSNTAPPCTSRVPIMQLDETAKTATLQWVDDLAPLFSFFGGSARMLPNGNIEYDACGVTVTGTGTGNNMSTIMEVTKTSPVQPVWTMQLTGQYAYRAFRIPSLYPGVQW